MLKTAFDISQSQKSKKRKKGREKEPSESYEHHIINFKMVAA